MYISTIMTEQKLADLRREWNECLLSYPDGPMFAMIEKLADANPVNMCETLMPASIELADCKTVGDINIYWIDKNVNAIWFSLLHGNKIEEWDFLDSAETLRAMVRALIYHQRQVGLLFPILGGSANHDIREISVCIAILLGLRPEGSDDADECLKITTKLKPRDITRRLMTDDRWVKRLYWATQRAESL